MICSEGSGSGTMFGGGGGAGMRGYEAAYYLPEASA